MATLTNTKIKDTYDGLLKTTDNDVIGASEKVITDGLGNASVLSIGTASASFTGDIDVTNSVLSVSDTANGTTLSLDASAGNSIYSDAPLNIYTVSDDMLFSTGGANSTRMTIDALGDISIEENLSVGGSLSSTEDATINGLTVGKGNGSLSTNIAVGVNALDSVTSGVDNTAIGHSTMQNLTLGVDNAAFGTGAMVSTTTGSYNTSIGSASLPVNTTGQSNTAVGLQAMQVNTTGGANTVVGMNALNDNTEGNRNTTLGFGSGNGIITGSDNIHIGYNTTSGATDVSNEIVIGSNTTGNGSNTATYGNSNITDHYFDGNITLTDATNPVLTVQDTAGGSSFLRLLSGDTGTSNIYLGDATDDNAGAIVYDHSDNSMSFRTNGFLEKMSIDSSGVVITGTVDINSNSLQLTGATNPQVLVTDTTNSVSVGLQALDASTKIDSTHSFKIEIGNDIIQSVTSSGVEITGNLAVDTNTLYVDAANNRVGIGTSSPNQKLELMGNNAYDSKLRFSYGSGATDYFADWGYKESGEGNKVFLTITDAGVSRDVLSANYNGNVGINCSPNSKLQVVGSVQDQIRFGSNTSVYTDLWMGTGYTVFDSIGGNSGAFDFRDNGVSRMFIDASGNVGINVNPSVKLDVYRGSSGVVANFNGINAYGAETGITLSQGRAKISGFLNTGGATPGSNLRFYTMPDSGSVTERMRIDSSGNVLMNTQTSLVADSSTATGLSFDFLRNLLHVSRSNGNAAGFNRIGSDGAVVNFHRAGTIVGSVSVTSLLTAYNTSSDYRLKENVVEMTGALDRVDALKPSRFNFIADPKTTVDGFLAHEVAEVVPEAVTGEKDAVDEEGNPIYQGIDQSKLTPLLTAALKEAHALIKSLEARIEILENK